MIAFASPPALWALTALALPIALHLYRRRQRPQPVTFAALRWLPEGAPARRRWRLREPLLLVLRCALLATLALWLAQPAWRQTSAGRPWLVVAPGVAPADVDRIASADAERRWLAPGFPLLNEAPSPAPVAVASLLRELDAHVPAATAVTVVVPEVLDGLDGARIALSRSVRWEVVAAETAPAQVQSTNLPALRAVVAAPDAAGAPYLRAAWSAWHAQHADGDAQVAWLTPDAPPPRASGAAIWASTESVPPAWRAWIESGGWLLAIGPGHLETDAGLAELWRSGAGTARVFGGRLGRGQWRVLDCALEPRCLPELHEPNFPALLRDWLQPPASAPTRAHAAHVAPHPSAPAWPAPERPLAPWLALVAALLFALERTLASGRRVP